LMLPPDLIRVRRRKGVIRPTYASDEHLSLAKTLVLIHEENIGGTRGELIDALSGCEELGFDYKLVRGLSAVLLEEHCVFQSRAVVSPMDARSSLFEEAAGVIVATDEDRKRVLTTVAFRMGVSAGDLEKSLYADLYDEQELTEFKAIQPTGLLKKYNFALTLSLLAHAKRLELTYRVKDEEIEELCKKLGKCSVSRNGSTKVIAEWKPTSRIGYKASLLEDLLSRQLSKGGWELAAEVVYPIGSGKTYRFEISYKLEGKLLKPGKRVQGLVAKAQPKHEPLARPKGEIIDVQETALRLGITETDLKKMYEEFVDLGGILITREKLGEVKRALENAADMRLEAVQQVLKNLGCRNPIPVLEALGYAVEWAKDRGESRVYRFKRGTTQ
jgi:predicted nuclease of restriction endonuclease-like RecB superfamily